MDLKNTVNGEKMSLNNPLANALSKLMMAEKTGRKECMIKPASKTIMNVLKVLHDNHYIGSLNEIEDGKGRIIKVNLIGKINKCGVIRPQHHVKKIGFEKFEKRYLPATDFGIIVATTPEGILTHKEIMKKGIGGILLAYCY